MTGSLPTVLPAYGLAGFTVFGYRRHGPGHLGAVSSDIRCQKKDTERWYQGDQDDPDHSGPLTYPLPDDGGSDSHPPAQKNEYHADGYAKGANASGISMDVTQHEL